MLLLTRVVAVLFIASATSAMAACPAMLTGTTADAITANNLRLLCLQQELGNETAARQNEFDLKALQQSLQDEQLQRRFDALPPVVTPQPFVPNTL